MVVVWTVTGLCELVYHRLHLIDLDLDSFLASGNEWTMKTFNSKNEVQDKEAFLKEDVIVFVDPKSGEDL